jgi:hypothetical protein
MQRRQNGRQAHKIVRIVAPCNAQYTCGGKPTMPILPIAFAAQYADWRHLHDDADGHKLRPSA